MKQLTAIAVIVALIGTVIHGSVPYANAQTEPTPTVIFTQRGKEIGRDSEPKANDLIIIFGKVEKVFLTLDGKRLGDGMAPPKNADGFRAEWKLGKITKFEWIQLDKNAPQGYKSISVTLPKKLPNDIEFDGIVFSCIWTKDGKFLRYCKLPEKVADDFKFVVPESPIGIIAVIASSLAVFGYWITRKNPTNIKI